jgi:predicted Zn-dependent peptidase
VMALLGEILFPTDQSRAFFTEDLEGSLDITTTYDYIQISATGKTSELLAMIETISNAVVNPQITPENFKLVQANRLKKVAELEKNPTYIADRAVAKRLLGEFPYGRTAEGTAESLAKIDYADVLFAKQRFLTADNATIAFVGNVKNDFVYKATRQLFGNWTKADKKIPATFAMPNEPDLKPQIIYFTPTDEKQNRIREVRFATRGIARNDKDYWATRFLLDILQNQLQTQIDEQMKGQQVKVYFFNERLLLPGIIFFRLSRNLGTTSTVEQPKRSNSATDSFANAGQTFAEIFKISITSAEFEQTKSKILSEIDQKTTVDKTLDVETFKLISVADEIKKLNSVAQGDVQRVADRLAKQSLVSVMLRDSRENKQ